MPVEAAAILSLFHAETASQCVDAGLIVAGSYAATGQSNDGCRNTPRAKGDPRGITVEPNDGPILSEPRKMASGWCPVR